MTVGLESERRRFFGLRRRKVTEVMDHRAYTEDKGSGITVIGRPDIVMLTGYKALRSGKMPHEVDFEFASAVTENNVEVRMSTGLTVGVETVVYEREEINEANLVSERGERIVWWKTREGDYPPLKEGQIPFRPYQDTELVKAAIQSVWLRP